MESAAAAPEGTEEDSDIDVSDTALLSPLLCRVLASTGGGEGAQRPGAALALWEETKRLLPALGAM